MYIHPKTYIQIKEENTMEQLAKFITDERTGLKYELCGDYYIIASEDKPEREPIGMWGQKHLNYIKKHSKPFYNKMSNEGKLKALLWAGGERVALGKPFDKPVGSADGCD